MNKLHFSKTALPSISREELKAYADASGDQNPIHQDDEFARSVGLPSVIVHGMMSMSLLSNYLRETATEYEVKKFRTKFRKITQPDVPLHLNGEIRSQSDQLVSVSVWIENEAGEKLTEGEAELSLGKV